jgi:CRISPR/Cas system endoribonuclease Cas6 (RAMP superfamily)
MKLFPVLSIIVNEFATLLVAEIRRRRIDNPKLLPTLFRKKKRYIYTPSMI